MSKLNFEPLARHGFIAQQITTQERELIHSVPGLAQDISNTNDDVEMLKQKFDADLAESLYSYGVMFNTNLSTTDLQRTGNMQLHRTLPVQSGMRRCVINDVGGDRMYLNAQNSLLNNALNVDYNLIKGDFGQVMVEVPAHYRKFIVHSSLEFEVRISTVAIFGYHFVPLFYISAFEASLDRTSLKMTSVFNQSTSFRGGNNNSAWDAASNSLLGCPVTSLTMANERLYARNRGAGWESMPYANYLTVWMLYHIEYANTNCQLAVSAPDAATGFRTGGLGNGVTTANGTEWGNFNGHNPFIKCGSTAILGNNSGEVQVAVPDFGGAGVSRTFTANSYRGIENPFGHIWKRAQGVYVDVKAPADGGTSRLFVQPNPALWNDVSMAQHIDRGLIARNTGHIRNMMFGEYGDILPTNTVGAGTTTFFADNHEASPGTTSIRCVLFSANAHGGAAGWSYSFTHYTPAIASASIGARLCYLPQ